MPDNKQNQQSNDAVSIGDELSLSEIEKMLKDEGESVSDEVIEEGEKEEEKKEGEEEEEEKVEGEEEPDVEEIANVRRADIVKKYPTLFKEFPDLERAFYRDKSFTEAFATPQEAQDALDRLNQFDQLETDIMGGNSQTILTQLKEADKESFVKFADDFLPTLQKIDEGLYHGILGNMLKSATAVMLKASSETDNEEVKKTLQNAAAVFYQFMFGSTKFEPPKPLSAKTESPEKDKLAEERASFVKQKFDAAATDVSQKTNNTLKAVVDKYIDPKGQMSSYTKGNAIRDVMERVHDALNNDPIFRKTIDRLWQEAFKDDFSDAIKTKIRNTWFNAAKSVVQQEIKNVRAEALKGQTRQNVDEGKKRPLPAGRPGESTSKRVVSAKEIPRGMKTIDFLNSD